METPRTCVTVTVRRPSRFARGNFAVGSQIYAQALLRPTCLTLASLAACTLTSTKVASINYLLGYIQPNNARTNSYTIHKVLGILRMKQSEFIGIGGPWILLRQHYTQSGRTNRIKTRLKPTIKSRIMVLGKFVVFWHSCQLSPLMSSKWHFWTTTKSWTATATTQGRI